MVLQFYADMRSPPCRAVAIFLKCNKIPHKLIKINVIEGEHMKPEYAKINPMKKVPCIVEDDGFVLTESNAIVKYLMSKPTVPKLWYPTFAKQRARVDEFQAWLHGGLRSATGGVFREQVAKVLFEKKEVDPAAMAAAKKALDEVLDKVESYFLKDRDWMAGSDITLADVLGICDLMSMVAIGYNVQAGHPRIAAWMQRVQERLNPHFDELHKELLEFGSKYKRARPARSVSVENGGVKK